MSKITTRRGTLLGVANGPNGPQAIIKSSIPGQEGTYLVEISRPGDEWEFEVTPDGTCYLESRARVKVGGLIQ